MTRGVKLSYVICYDIPDDKRRNQLAKCLDGFGDRVQYSVFEAVLDRLLFDNLVDEIESIIEPGQDRVSIYRLCADCAERSVFFGQAQLDERPGKEIVFIV